MPSGGGHESRFIRAEASGPDQLAWVEEWAKRLDKRFIIQFRKQPVDGDGILRILPDEACQGGDTIQRPIPAQLDFGQAQLCLTRGRLRLRMRVFCPAPLASDEQERRHEYEDNRTEQSGQGGLAGAPAPEALEERNGSRLDWFITQETAQFIGQSSGRLVPFQSRFLQALHADRFQ